MAIYCPQCGKGLPDDALFCDECGTKIPAVPDRLKTVSSPERKTVVNTVQPRKEPVTRKPEKARKGSFLGGLFKFVLRVFLIAAILYGALYFFRDAFGGIGRSVLREVNAAIYNATGIVMPGSDEINKASPDGNPAFREFSFYENDVLVNGVPSAAKSMKISESAGEWKYYLIYNAGSAKSRYEEIGLASIRLQNGSAVLKLTAQKCKYGKNGGEEKADVSYENFTGTFDQNGMYLKGNNSTVTVGTFYTYRNVQYGYGSILNSSGEIISLVLIRP